VPSEQPTDKGVALEKTPCVVRAIGLESYWNSIIHSGLSPSENETIVNAEIKYFTQLTKPRF